jgi:hypothetical protein
LARIHVQAAINTLVDVMTNTESPAGARISAAESILNRACGRPASTPNSNLQDDFADILAAAATIRAARNGAAAAGHAGGRAAPADGGVGGAAPAVRY